MYRLARQENFREVLAELQECVLPKYFLIPPPQVSQRA